MTILKVIFKKLKKVPKIHLIGFLLAFLVINQLFRFMFGNISFATFQSISVKAIILLATLYGIYFAHVFVYNAAEESNQDDDMPEVTYTMYPSAPTPKPGHYGTNIKVNVTTTPESKKAEELKEAIEKFNLSKSKTKSENKPIPSFNEQPKSNPKPIVKEGESKAEKEGNTILNEEGKPIVKPNYKMIASEWVKNNLELLNKICNDAYAISGGSSEYSATIPAAYLPEEKASWIVIGKTLVAEDDITSFKILKEGLEVTVS
jgi:hypothetical protein